MPGKRVAIVQSSYVPWKGYFDMINEVDEFILFDDRQFTRRDWRSRNRVKTAAGPRWLTIPVKVKGNYHQRIDETVVADPQWAKSHWRTLVQAYSAAPCFATYRDVFESCYLGIDTDRLSQINRTFIETVCGALDIGTKLSWSTEYAGVGDRSGRLASICVAAGASVYLSGPTARSYIQPEAFEEAGVELQYMDYTGYGEYPQIHPPFDHQVSILDLLFNTGEAAADHMLTFRGDQKRQGAAWGSGAER